MISSDSWSAFFHTTLCGSCQPILLYWLYRFLSPTFILIYCFLSHTSTHWHCLLLLEDSGYIGSLPVNNCEKGKNREESERDFVDSVPGWMCPWLIEQVHYDVWRYSLILWFSEKAFWFSISTQNMQRPKLSLVEFQTCGHDLWRWLQIEYLFAVQCAISDLFYEVETFFSLFATMRLRTAA